MHPVRKNSVSSEDNLFPVRILREKQQDVTLKSNAPDTMQVSPEDIRVPDIRATAARLRRNPPVQFIPDIQTTAAYPSCREDTSSAHFPSAGYTHVNIRTTAQRLRNETVRLLFAIALDIKEKLKVTAGIPDMTYMAQELLHCEEMGFPEAEMMEEPFTPALRFTETLQVSYNPDMGLYENVKECDCVQRCKEVIDSMKMNRWPKGSRKKGARYGPYGKELVKHALDFAKELKTRLKETCAGVVFQSPTEITALALGISERTLNRMGHELQEEPKRQKGVYNRKKWTEATLTRYGPRWGEIIKQAIHRRLRDEEDMTIADLHEELSSAHEDFTLCRATLHRLVRGLGFSFKKNPGQRFIFERSDLVAKRDRYLEEIASARERGEYLVYMDETWVFSGMTKTKGWNDNNIPRFAPRSTFAKYSYGKTASKNKGKRAIVIGALAGDGIIPECTRVFVGGMVDDGDYHREMNHSLFETWLRDCLPHMKERANGRRVCLVMDNAPYHTRQEEKVPTSSSTKTQIREFLDKKQIVVESTATKKTLLAELDKYVKAVGYSALRSYATERICNESGVNLIRLPPFHCFFNPIELCWSQLKGFLNKCGKVTDKIAVVRERTVRWMADVSADRASAWFRDAQKQEAAAREKQILDLEEDDETTSSEQSSCESLDDSEDAMVVDED